MLFVSHTNGMKRRIRLDQWKRARDRETGLEQRAGTIRSKHQRPEWKRESIQLPRTGDVATHLLLGSLKSPLVPTSHRFYFHSDIGAQLQAPRAAQRSGGRQSTTTRTRAAPAPREPVWQPGAPHARPGTRHPRACPAVPPHLSSPARSPGAPSPLL